MAAATVPAMDTLWDTRRRSDPTVTAAMTSHSRSLNQAPRQKGDRGNGACPQKVTHLPPTPSTNSKIPLTECISIAILGATKQLAVGNPAIVWKTMKPPSPSGPLYLQMPQPLPSIFLPIPVYFSD
jgi:hypothetical protein